MRSQLPKFIRTIFKIKPKNLDRRIKVWIGQKIDYDLHQLIDHFESDIAAKPGGGRKFSKLYWNLRAVLDHQLDFYLKSKLDIPFWNFLKKKGFCIKC